MKKETKKRSIPFVRKLRAHLSGEEIEAADERLRQYIRLGLQIHERNNSVSNNGQSSLKTPPKKSSRNKPIRVVLRGRE